MKLQMAFNLLTFFLNQTHTSRTAWFLKIDPVQIASMRVCVFACVFACVCVCVCVCVSAPNAINN